MAINPASSSILSKFIKPGRRIQSTDLIALSSWGVAAGTAGLFLVQPFDWIRKTFFEKTAESE